MKGGVKRAHVIAQVMMDAEQPETMKTALVVEWLTYSLRAVIRLKQFGSGPRLDPGRGPLFTLL